MSYSFIAFGFKHRWCLCMAKLNRSILFLNHQAAVQPSSSISMSQYCGSFYIQTLELFLYFWVIHYVLSECTSLLNCAIHKHPVYGSHSVWKHNPQLYQTGSQEPPVNGTVYRSPSCLQAAETQEDWLVSVHFLIRALPRPSLPSSSSDTLWPLHMLRSTDNNA